VSDGGTRIALVKRPIDQSIEKHGGGARQNHADHHQQQNSPGGPSICRHEQGAEGEGECEDRV
jgi:hypothetical protein